MRQDTALQLAILFLDSGVYLSTEPVSRRLAASAGKPDCTSAFPRCTGQLVAKGKVKEASGGQRYIRRVRSRTTGRDKASGTYMHAHTANLWAGSSNVVLDNASYSISNAVVLAKSLV